MGIRSTLSHGRRARDTRLLFGSGHQVLLPPRGQVLCVKGALTAGNFLLGPLRRKGLPCGPWTEMAWGRGVQTRPCPLCVWMMREFEDSHDQGEDQCPPPGNHRDSAAHQAMGASERRATRAELLFGSPVL